MPIIRHTCSFAKPKLYDEHISLGYLRGDVSNRGFVIFFVHRNQLN